MTRYLTAFGIAALVTISLFYLMQYLISGKYAQLTRSDTRNTIDIIRLKREENSVTKQRLLPEPPKEPESPSPLPTPQKSTQQLALAAPTLSLPLPGIPSFDLNQNLLANVNAEIALPTQSNEVVALLKVEPDYPRQAARQGTEGWVKLEFTVLEDGTVTDVKVLDANPKRIFNKSAIRAIQRWKFKPRLVNGKATRQQVVQLIEFKLK